MSKAVKKTKNKSKVFELIDLEKKRQKETVELIASENFVSQDVLRALGSCLTNKYTEGYPAERETGNKGRYYGGCQYYDELEEYCCQKWKEAFGTDYHCNVQPHSGSQANFAAYMAVLNPGDTILSMSLDNGGHLTHGSAVNFSGKMYNVVPYGVDEKGFIDYEDIAKKAEEFKPKLILAGASAYPREIEFSKIGEIAKANDAIFMVDMSHIAGLIIAEEHESPFGVADIITTTTHKTLRGPRGGMIFCKPELAKKIDSAVFPGTQGGSLQNVIAAKAVAAEEACTEEYKQYIHNVVFSCVGMAHAFKKLGYEVVTDGTDNHLLLLDFTRTHPNLTGKMVQEELDKHGITVNKNCVPNETRSPVQTSGIRIGTAAMCTKKWDMQNFVNIAVVIDRIIKGMCDEAHE